MQTILPPLCFLLALLAIVLAFALLAWGMPEPGIELHQAWASGDDEYRELLEEELQREQRRWMLLIGTLFVAGAFFTTAGFVAMRPA